MTNYADFTTAPPYYGRKDDIYMDEGQGIPKLSRETLTQDNVLRSAFLMSQEHHRPTNIYIETASKDLGSDSEVSRIFFSDRNIKRIQKMIKTAVLEKSDGKFRLDADQDEKDLIAAMSAVYRLKARYMNCYPVRQVKKLNTHTVNYVLPDIITNIKQYYGYLHEINTPLQPIDRPVNVNNAGRRSLPSVTTTWGLR